MSNHVHLLLLPEDVIGLSRVVQLTHKSYAYHINKRDGSVGHLWQERFYSSPVDRSAVLTTLKYILRTPVELDAINDASRYPWSSVRFHMKKERDLYTIYPDWWKDALAQIIDWNIWLSTPNIADTCARIRTSLDRDMLYGPTRFIRNIERELGINLDVRPRGRPKKQKKR